MRSSRRSATTGRTRPRRCTPPTRATSTWTSPRRSGSAPCSRSPRAAMTDDEAFRAFARRADLGGAASISEAEGELRSARLRLPAVVAFDGLGEAERARYNLDRLDAPSSMADRSRPTPGWRSPRRGSARASSPRSCGWPSIPFRRLVHRRRAAGAAPRRGARAARLRRPAGRRLRRPRGPRCRPLRRLRDAGGRAASPATTSTSSTRGEDRVYVPTDQLAKITRYVGAGGASRRSRRWGRSAGRT